MTDTANGTIKSKVFVRGTLVAQTGLHIGGNSIGMAIGGADAVVVRNPLSNEPYIPGSSLRGKMRALLERVRGPERASNGEGGFRITSKGDALCGEDPETKLGRLFGVAAEKGGTPTRLIVRDAPLTRASAERLKNAPNTDMPMTEVKTEVWIDRITSAANPRQTERVPAGAEFEFELILTLVGDDDTDEYLGLVYEGLRLLQADALGGKGSRGYGQVKFTVREVVERTAASYASGVPAAPLAGHEIPAEFTLAAAG
ncbi:MAG: type III-A CRISPR-associated RAMP protein Csm3 [Deltaproteobacteria bacterium]|nr:type III-A CRISPR-associated RAMP protein Csm3 [Deltaproteobacteria bacterium]